MTTRRARGVGLATVTDDGQILDVWYPQPHLDGEDPQDAEIAHRLGHLEKADAAREVHMETVTCDVDLDEAPQSTPDAYLRLHLLSHRLALPNSMNLDGIFAALPTIVWTSAGPCSPTDFEQTRARLREKNGVAPTVRSIDKFPAMVDFVIPSKVRIANGATVRLGAYLSEGTTIMTAGAVNFNAGTLGHAMVEGRISQGVVIGDGSDVGGGASLMGTLSGGGKQRVKLGERCLVGANAGLGIPLGDDCVVEAGLYVTAGTKVTVLPGAAPDGSNTEEYIVSARELINCSGLLFRRHSVSGRVEAVARRGHGIELNTQLHTAN